MKILLLGSGGREHTIAHKIREGGSPDKLFIAPGNAGTALIGENISTFGINDFEAMKNFCVEKKINLIIVGPEEPLVNGIFDYFEGTGIKVFGPSRAGAMLEGSKSFAKEFMKEFNIPTAKAEVVDIDRLDYAFNYIDDYFKKHPKLVLKADGLAAGKGVVIVDNPEDAKRELSEMLRGKFGKAGETVLLEDFLKGGIEYSFFVITDGKNYKILPVAKDYKRVGEGDTGPNTGGMGAVSSMDLVSKETMAEVEEKIIRPTINGLITRKIKYPGIIYFGLMQTDDGVKVIEYNCRFGDPETQVVLPRILTDFLTLVKATVNGTLQNQELSLSSKATATVVVASEGYPGEYSKGNKVHLPYFWNDYTTKLYYGGITEVQGNLVTNGGRVAAVTVSADFLSEAIEAAVAGAELMIRFQGKFFRKDIGHEFVPKAIQVH